MRVCIRSFERVEEGVEWVRGKGEGRGWVHSVVQAGALELRNGYRREGRV